MKLFEIVIQEQIGEKEWTHNLLIQARTLRAAERKANTYARRYWSSWEDNEPVRRNRDGQYEFNGGEIVVSIEDVSETTKEKFLEESFERALIS